LTEHPLYNISNNANLVHNLFLICLFLVYQSLHVSIDYVPIIRTNNCVYATLGTCYSVWITLWYVRAYTPAYKYQESHKHSCFSWWRAHSRSKHVENDILRINILRIKRAPSCFIYKIKYNCYVLCESVGSEPITVTHMEFQKCSKIHSINSCLQITKLWPFGKKGNNLRKKSCLSARKEVI